MGVVFTGLTPEELCDLMCGNPETDYEEMEGNDGHQDGED